jgi:hypothetical protein
VEPSSRALEIAKRAGLLEGTRYANGKALRSTGEKSDKGVLGSVLLIVLCSARHPLSLGLSQFV